MEQMSKQASHTVYRNRSGSTGRPQLRPGAPQLHAGVDVPAYDESILERLQQVDCPHHARHGGEEGAGDSTSIMSLPIRG